MEEMQQGGAAGRPDWDAIRAEYESRQFLPSAICRRHGVTVAQLRYRRQVEGWLSIRARPPTYTGLVARILEVLDRQIRQLEKAMDMPIDKQANILATQVPIFREACRTG